MTKSLFEVYKEIQADRKAKIDESVKLMQSLEAEAEKRRREWRIQLSKNEKVGFTTTLSPSSSSSAAAGAGSGGRRSSEVQENSYVDDSYVENYFV